MMNADFFSVMTSSVCPDGAGVFDRPEPPLEGWTALILDSLPLDSLPLCAALHGATRTAVRVGALELDSDALCADLHVGALLLHAPPEVAPLLCVVSDSHRLSFETDFLLPHAQFEQPICTVSGWRVFRTHCSCRGRLSALVGACSHY